MGADGGRVQPHGHGGSADDTIAAFSSRGPTAIDNAAKPDVVAPGVGIESLSDPDSAFYVSKAPYLLGGTVATAYLPYLSLSGTSVAAPVVSGTVALMLQANPTLTPNAVKAILQYTSQVVPGLRRAHRRARVPQRERRRGTGALLRRTGRALPYPSCDRTGARSSSGATAAAGRPA